MAEPYLIWSFLLTYVVHSTFLLGAAWCLFRFGRWHSPTLRETVWKFAAITPFLTTLLHVGIVTPYWSVPIEVQAATEQSPEESQLSDTELVSRKIRESHNTEHVDHEHDVGEKRKLTEAELREIAELLIELETLEQEKQEQTQSPIREHHETELVEINQPEKVENSSAAPPAANGFTTRQLFGILGFCLTLIVVYGLSRILVNFGRLNWALQNATPMKRGRALELLSELQDRYQIRRRIRLFQLEQISEPAACGWINWSVLLPPELDAQLTDDELEAALSHELAHLVRKDVWWLWIGRALCWLFPFQPLNYIAQREWRDAAESLCDQWAIDQGVSRFSLARSLTSVASISRVERVAYSLSATGSGGQQLTERVEHLLEEQSDNFRSRNKRLVLLGGAVLLVSGLLIWSPRIVIQASQVNEEHEESDHVVPDTESHSKHHDAIWREYTETRQEAERLNESLEGLIPLTETLSTEVRERSENLLQRTNQLTERIQDLEELMNRFEHVESKTLNSNQE